MTSREQFEAFLQDKYGYQPRYIADKRESYSYNRSSFQGLWEAWQASREAVEVDFPPPEPDRGTDSQVDISAGFSNRMRSKCIESIRAAGIKVKGE